MIEIVPTIVPDSLEDIRRMRERYAGFLTALHVDTADGMFAPNTTWMPEVDEKLPDAESIWYVAHLMVKSPRAVGLAFLAAGARGLEAHAEAFSSPEDGLATFAAWRAAGAQKVAIALLFQTPLEAVEPYLGVCDYVRLMTIARIGKQGIPFEEASITRISEFHMWYSEMPIAVDGGVSEKNIQMLARAGATSFAVGGVIAKSPDPARTYQQLLSLANRV